MPLREELLELELAGWNALSSSGGEASSFYGGILDERCLMLLPGGIVIESREEAVSSMQQGPPWDSFELDQARILELVDDVAVLAYRASAHRGESRYRAWINSTYIRREGEWRLTLHQQTPDDD